VKCLSGVWQWPSAKSEWRLKIRYCESGADTRLGQAESQVWSNDSHWQGWRTTDRNCMTFYYSVWLVTHRRVRLHWSQNRHNTANQHLSGHTLQERVAILEPTTVFVHCNDTRIQCALQQVSGQTVGSKQTHFVGARQSGEITLQSYRFHCRRWHKQ
jgi:hypothetical protein